MGIAKVDIIDPDDGDAVPSAGDTVTVTFDRLTNQGSTANNIPTPNTKAFVDFYWIFNPSIGTDYRGQFVDVSTFTIEILTGNPNWTPIIPTTGTAATMSVRPAAQLRTSSGISTVSDVTYSFDSGSWGALCSNHSPLHWPAACRSLHFKYSLI